MQFPGPGLPCRLPIRNGVLFRLGDCVALEMGLRQTRHKDMLDGSEWLRTAVQHHQKRRGAGAVSSFESFLTEPFVVVANEDGALRLLDQEDEEGDEGGGGGGGLDERAAAGQKRRRRHRCSAAVRYAYQDGGVRLTKANVRFRNSKQKLQEVHWVVKSAGVQREGTAAVQNLTHEAKVFASLLPEAQKFLAGKGNPRCKYLLNIPDFVFQERRREGGNAALAIEDVTKTKRCSPIEFSQMLRGLNLGSFRVFLGTLAQFHAVGLAWNISKSDSLDSFPFLNRPDPDFSSIAERERLLIMYDKLLRWRLRMRPRDKAACQRRAKLFRLMRSASNDIWRTSARADKCDSLGGLCLGPVVPCELMFQHERTAATNVTLTGEAAEAATVTSMFEFCTNPTYINGLDLLSEEDRRRLRQLRDCPPPPPPPPVCAALPCLARVHFGLVVRELAQAFFVLPAAELREHYIVLLLQNYCHVLTTTLEILDVDWIRHFQMTFPRFLHRFYEHVPHGILTAILQHMKMTDPEELECLVLQTRVEECCRGCGCCCGSEHRTNEDAAQNVYIPLTSDRIEFLEKLIDPVHKPI